MTLSPKLRLRLGCGEALGPGATEVRRPCPPPAWVRCPFGGAMPRVPIGVLKQR